MAHPLISYLCHPECHKAQCIYIDDITELQLSDGSMTVYADDIMLYHPIYTPADYSLLQLDIDDICTWTTNNLKNLIPTNVNIWLFPGKDHLTSLSHHSL